MAKKNKEPLAQAAPAGDIEVVAKPGMGLEEALVLTTTFLLALAITLVIMASKVYQ